MSDVLNHIDGAAVPAIGGGWLDNWNPSIGEVYGRLPDSDARDVDAAVAAAKRAFPAWSAKPPSERARMLRLLARLLDRERNKLAPAEAVDSGKPVRLAATLDMPRSSANLDFFADAATQFSTECYPVGDEALNYTLRQPLGVVAAISPWNLPLYLLTWKIAPALAAGNCVVAKPSEVTPMTAFLMGQLAAEAGFPPGVLNLVHGLGAKAGSALCEHPDVKAISFTGSTRTGASISAVAAPKFKKLSLELGGKNANIIFADADLDEALVHTLGAAFRNQGQICLCGSRVLVERPIYEVFRDRLIAKTKLLKQGDPMDGTVDQGAVVSSAHFDKVMGCVAKARDEGGRILIGGDRANVAGRCAKGWFVQPTLIEGLGPDSSTNQEEIFGPVATLQPFDTVDEAVELANNSRYGLAASLFTRDVKRAHNVAARLRTGIVWVNTWMMRDLRTPFGGVKESGVGREGGWEAMRFFTEAKNICIKL